ncbi:MAG: hypothetical protein R3223_08525 [Longimicrobiales bacterium]|nr:hypothetical protein [Longimicrobiales bacterium]
MGASLAVLVALATLALTGPLAAQDFASADEAEFTYSEDIAPLFNESCVACHREGSIAPMPLTTSEEVKQWAPLIKFRVQERIMPPWHIDPTIGVQEFKNDRSLTQEQIDMVATWVDAGAPQGDPSLTPELPEAPSEYGWRLDEEAGLGEPDLVVRTDPFTIPAQGQDKWWRPVVPTGLEEERWLRAIEVRPSPGAGLKVTHHVLVGLIQDETEITGLASTAQDEVMSGGLLTEFAIGKAGEIYPENTGKLMLPGSQLDFEVHYWPAGERVEDDQVEVGLWFYPRGERPKYRTILSIFNASPRSTLQIPPHSMTMHDQTFRLPAPARLESFQPHMHMRGKAMSMEAIYPDGRREMLSMVDNFQFAWHINYLYDTDAAPLLPAGTILEVKVWHDNTDAAPTNPDPDQFVVWGDRAVDEMGHAWVGVTYLEQEDFEQMVAEREENVAEEE